MGRIYRIATSLIQLRIYEKPGDLIILFVREWLALNENFHSALTKWLPVYRFACMLFVMMMYSARVFALIS